MAEASQKSPEQENKRNSLEVNSRLPADCLQGHEPGARGWYGIVQMFVVLVFRNISMQNKNIYAL
jgi:hypothetical protein